MGDTLVLYGHPVSQPTRAVMWLLALKDKPYEFRKADPMTGGTRTPEFVTMNPTRQIPVLTVNGEPIAEAAAIMTFLCDRYGWRDLLPAPGTVARARVDQYNHWHHLATRSLATLYFRPSLMAVAMGKPLVVTDALKKQQRRLGHQLAIIDAGLRERKWISGPTMTISDLFCYSELAQGRFFPDWIDRAKLTGIDRWIKQMEAVAHHDALHQELDEMLDMINSKLRAKL